MMAMTGMTYKVETEGEGRKAMGGKPHPIDVRVGQRIRARRVMLGITQTQLAEALGISFQQVQKYENASNRVSGSRLQQIADVLEVPVSFFFEQDESEGVGPQDRGFAEMARLYSKLSPELQKQVRNIMRALACAA